MLAILAPIFVFGLVIFVHELGHFLAAKSVGVYTPRFSIGFGPALWRKRRGETEYILAAFPLGGYVRMASRLDEATAALEGGSEEAAAEKVKASKDWDPEAMIPFGPKPVPEHRWFESKPLWARLYILVAGVTMNFILGIVVAIALAFSYGDTLLPTRPIGSIRPVNGVPLLSALHVGDTIVSVNDDRARTWTHAIRAIAASKGQVDIRTTGGSVTIPLDGPGQPSGRDVAEALSVELPAVIGGVIPGDVAAKAGLQAGDSIVAIDGKPIRTWTDMVAIVASSADKPIMLEYSRAGTVHRQSVTPRAQPGVNPITGAQGTVGKIGAAQDVPTVREPVPIQRAVRIGLNDSWAMATSIVTTVRDLVTRRVSVDQLGGPIAITRASVAAARSGLENLFYLIALLSINVGILNLLPIPILDGGQVVINVLESARGKAFSLRTREYILRGGLFFILLLFVLVMFNDTRALFR